VNRRLVALALATGLICPACYHASTALDGNLVAVASQDSPQAHKYPLKVELIASPTDGIRWEGCGTSEDICTLVLEPALTDAMKNLLRTYFEQVDLASSLDAANRDGDLVAIESVVTFPAQGSYSGFIRLTLVFKDPDSGHIVAEPTAAEKIKLDPVMNSGKHIALIFLDVASADLFLPLHAYIANRDGLDALSEAAVPAVASVIQSLGQQIASDPRLAAYAASHPSRETVDSGTREQASAAP
jgi:hypothetical protein